MYLTLYIGTGIVRSEGPLCWGWGSEVYRDQLY